MKFRKEDTDDFVYKTYRPKCLFFVGIDEASESEEESEEEKQNDEEAKEEEEEEEGKKTPVQVEKKKKKGADNLTKCALEALMNVTNIK